MTDYYPTIQHKNAADAIVEFFGKTPDAQIVLLVNSCARGKATRDSCLDMLVIFSPETMKVRGTEINKNWETFHRNAPVFRALEGVGVFAEIHLDIEDGVYKPAERNWTGGPDEFELAVGNHLAYSVPLLEQGERYSNLKAQWLPYYDEDLRTERLAIARKFLLNDIDHIPVYVPRGLIFQSFDRLYNAYREFLQALFITRRTYPIAYDKWIREQIVEILDEPDLYEELKDLLSIHPFDGPTILAKSQQLERLVQKHIENAP